MLEQFSRTELLLGRDAIEKLSRAKVIVFGVCGRSPGKVRCGQDRFGR